jgi:hypothetical protein
MVAQNQGDSTNMIYSPFQTVEVRWFYFGEIPTDVKKEYFRNEGYIEAQPERVDSYLSIAGDTDLGIKIREGRLEIKHRTSTFGTCNFGSQVSGILEGWEKWGFAITERFYSHNVKDTDGWVKVRKIRWLKKFQATKDLGVKPILSNIQIDLGCEWELSKVQLIGLNGIWWSTAFEAFGGNCATREKILIEVVKNYLKPTKNWDYKNENSLSYPAWLNLLISSGDF